MNATTKPATTAANATTATTPGRYSYALDSLTDQDLESNIIQVLGFTRRDSGQGERWYLEANELCAELSERFGRPLETVAGILAALSPGCSWERNQALAATMLATGDCNHSYGDPIRKGRRILEGEPPLTVLKGDKVRNFFACITDPGHPGAVVIDRHAYDIVVGQPTSDHERKALLRQGSYDRIAGAYRRVADRAGILPSQVQALTWVSWRLWKQAPAAA